MAARPTQDSRVLSHGRGGAGKLPFTTVHAFSALRLGHTGTSSQHISNLAQRLLGVAARI